MSFAAMLWNVLIPAGLCGVGCLGWLWWARRRQQSLPGTHGQRIAGELMVSSAIALGIAASVLGRHSWEKAGELYWLHGILPVIATVFLFAFVNGAQTRLFLVTGGACLLGSKAMPSGEEWAELLPLHATWAPLVIGAAVLNYLVLQRLAERGGQRWVLWLTLAGIGGSLTLASSCYASLTEWGVAVAVLTLVAATTATFAPTFPISGYILLGTMSMALITATARFYTYDEHPSWAYGTTLFLPSLVATLDGCWPARRNLLRPIIAAVVSGATVGLLFWAYHLNAAN